MREKFHRVRGGNEGLDARLRLRITIQLTTVLGNLEVLG